MSLTTWEYNGASFELDLQDVDTLKRYEDAFERTTEEEKMVPEVGKASEILQCYCEVFIRLFDRLFGEGSAVKILGTSKNARACDEAYDALISFVDAQNMETNERRNALIAKYSGNRAQRRKK